MTRVGSPLIPRAASATGLETCVIEVRLTLMLHVKDSYIILLIINLLKCTLIDVKPFKYFCFLFQNWIGNYRRSFKAPSEPRPSKPKLHTRELSPYNLFCRDLLRNKGKRQNLTDAFKSYIERFVVVHTGRVYIRAYRSREKDFQDIVIHSHAFCLE